MLLKFIFAAALIACVLVIAIAEIGIVGGPYTTVLLVAGVAASILSSLAANSLPGAVMTEPTIVDRFFSLDLVAIVLGFVGALLGVSYSEPMTKKQLLAALGSGSIVAALAPPLVTLLIHLQWPTVNLPVAINNVMAFVFGIGGMFIIPGVLSFWKTFSANPWGFIDRIRGITPPPPPPGAQP